MQLGGPHVELRTGRRDSKRSYAKETEIFIPNHNDSMSSVLSRFQSIGIDVEGTVALLGISILSWTLWASFTAFAYSGLSHHTIPQNKIFKGVKSSQSK